MLLLTAGLPVASSPPPSDLPVDLLLTFYSRPPFPSPHSKSPLNGQAAELWDSDPKEYKRLLMLRHRDVDDE